MSTDLLTLAQWLSPAYPVGSFAYSHGIETAIRDGQIADGDSLRDWLGAVLTEGTGRTDAVLLVAAHGATTPERLEALHALAGAFVASAERLREGTRQGAAFAATTRAVWGLDLADLFYPVAVGRAAGLKGLSVEETAAMYLHTFMSNLVSASVRLVPLGQTEGQKVLAALTPICRDVAAKALDSDPDELWSNAWGSDIASMRHETMEPRLFQS